MMLRPNDNVYLSTIMLFDGHNRKPPHPSPCAKIAVKHGGHYCFESLIFVVPFRLVEGRYVLTGPQHPEEVYRYEEA